jgi:hypothetical protein
MPGGGVNPGPLGATRPEHSIAKPHSTGRSPPPNAGEETMIASAKLIAEPCRDALDYLGFTVERRGESSFVATSKDWNHNTVVTFEAASLPAIRKRIWSWWHRLLD